MSVWYLGIHQKPRSEAVSMNPNTWWSPFGTLEVLFQSKPHVPHVLVSERCLRWINGWGETPKIHSLPPPPPPQKKKENIRKTKTTLRFRNHGIIDGKLLQQFFSPPFVEDKTIPLPLFRLVTWNSLQRRNRKLRCWKAPGGTEVMCGSVILSAQVVAFVKRCGRCVSSWKRWNSWQHKIGANRDQWLGGWSSKVVPLQSGFFHCCNFKLLFFLKPKNTSKSNSNSTYMGVS